MAHINGKYEFVKQENIVEFLVGLGVSADKAKLAEHKTHGVEIVLDGNNFTVKGERTSTHEFGVTKESVLPFTDTLLKSTATLNGETVTIAFVKDNSEKGGSAVYQFEARGALLTVTSSKPDVPAAKLYYKRV